MHCPPASTLASGQTWLRWCDWLSIRSSGLGRSSRGFGGSRSSRSSLGRHAFRDHAAAFAVATGAAAADDLATATARAAALNSSRLTTAARAAAFDGSRITAAAARRSSSLTAARLTSRSSSSSGFAVATVLLVAEETAVAALLLVGKQTAVAAGTAMAAVASNGTRVTADEGDGNESNEHGETESENTLHHIPPDGNIERGVRS